MRVKEDEIFSEFHKRRIEEFVPAMYFINEYHLSTSKNTFLTKYRTWRRKNSIPFVDVSVENYLRWFASHYKVIYSELLEFYRKSCNKSNNGSSLATAMYVYHSVHPETNSSILLKDCGMSITTLRNRTEDNK